MRALDLLNHMGQLVTNNGMFDELLTKGLSFAGIFKSLLVTDSGESAGAHVGSHSKK